MIRALERWFPYILIFPALLPLLYVDGLLYPYLTLKTILFRADFLLALAAGIALILSGHAIHYTRLKYAITWVPAGLLGWAYLASLVGIDFYHSFWSLFDRGDGLLTLTAIVGFFYLYVLFADEALFRRLFKVVSVVATLVATFALLQWVQDASGLNLPLIPEARGRIGSTLGNAAFLASYLCMTFFVTLITARDLGRVWQKRAHIAAGLQLLAVVLSATRGALIALLAAGFVTLVYLAWRKEGRVRTYAQGSLAALVVLAGVFFVFKAELADAPFAPVARLASISLTDTTTESRLFLWQEIGREALQSPIVGVGAEQIEVLFNRVYDPTAIVEQWFDRSHNVYIDYLAQYGVPGLALYLVLIALFAQRAYVLTRERETRFAGQMLFLLVMVYAIQNIFVFDTASTLWLLFVLFAAFFIADQKARTLVTTPPPFTYAVGALIILLIIPVSVQPLRANLALAQGYLYHVADANRAITSMRGGLALNTYADLEYGYQLYEMYTERQAVMLTGSERIAAYEFARDVLSQNLENYPYDTRTATYLAHVLDVVPPEVTQDETALNRAINRAIELSPKRIQPWYLRANIAIRAGDILPQGSAEKAQHYRDAIAIMQEYASRVPRFAEPAFVIATLYQTLGDHVSAQKWADQALPLYTRPDENTARRASRYYITIEDWEHARRFLRDVANVTGDPKAKYDLAKAEFLAGNIEMAAELVGQLQEETPGLVETDPAFMQALQEAL